MATPQKGGGGTAELLCAELSPLCGGVSSSAVSCQQWRAVSFMLVMVEELLL